MSKQKGKEFFLLNSFSALRQFHSPSKAAIWCCGVPCGLPATWPSAVSQSDCFLSFVPGRKGQEVIEEREINQGFSHGSKGLDKLKDATDVPFLDLLELHLFPKRQSSIPSEILLGWVESKHMQWLQSLVLRLHPNSLQGKQLCPVNPSQKPLPPPQHQNPTPSKLLLCSLGCIRSLEGPLGYSAFRSVKSIL